MDCPSYYLVVLVLCIGVVISYPQEGAPPEITRMHVRSDIAYRFATTNVSSTLANPDAAHAMEATFLVLMPRAAFITYFEMVIDGVTYPGTVKEKEAARQQYERAKKKGQSAGKVSQQGHDQGTFKVSVNVAAGSQVHFNLTYQELLQRRFGVYQHVISIKPGQVVPDLRVDVYIRESRDITVLKVPANLKEYGNTIDSTENKLASVRRLGSSGAHVSYAPTPAQQKQDGTASGVSGHLVVEYDVQRDLDAGEIQVSDGYFVHFFAPTGLTAVKKTVLFILDTSGSMQGLSIQQVKQAMKVIIDDLRPDDKFALMSFSDNVHINPHPGRTGGRRRGGHGEQLILATPENKEMGKDMVQALQVGGGTNINDALVGGLAYLAEQEASEEAGGGGGDTRTSMLIFLTDGEPTTGITSNPQIITNVKAANDLKIPIFGLAFGGGAEFPFLAKLSLQNNGLARRIYLDSDPELQLQGFYHEISTPILNDIKITYVGDTISADSLTDASFHNYFDGSEIIVAGRLHDNGIETLVTQVSATGAIGYMELDMDVDVQTEERKMQQSDVPQFTERLWAYLTIKKLMDTMLQSDNPQEKAQAKAKALELSLKYSFVTPLTSMVVTKPEDVTEDTGKESIADDPKPPQRSTSASQPSASQARQHHSSRSFVDNDPHFIISMSGLTEGVCFDIDGEPGTVYQLLHDPRGGITVNGLIVAPEKQPPGGKHRRTFFGEIAVLVKNASIRLVLSPHKILINGQHFTWKASSDLNAGGVRIRVEEKRKVTVTVRGDVVFSILRHVNKRRSEHKVDYLGFYVQEGSGLSRHADGLIGQFIHQTASIVEEAESLPSRLLLPGGADHVESRAVEVRLGKRRNMDLDAHVPCWFVRNNGRGLLRGRHTDYLVPSLTEMGRAHKMAAAGRKHSSEHGDWRDMV